MEGDDFSEFIVTKQPTKMYSSYSNNDKADEDTKDIFSSKRQPLTTKTALELLLDGTLKYKVCRYCLNVDTSLYEMDQVFQIGGQGTMYKVTIKDMVACFYPFQIIEDSNYPKKICENCLDKAMQAYLFTQKCEQSGRALHNCFEDMYEKLDKLDPVERTKKRGRQKLNPNFNTLFAEHKKVIDYAEPIINIINKGSQLVEENVDKITDLECPRCWQTFTNLESLMNHEKIHPKSMWFHCRLCGNSFVKRHLYRKHVKSVHSQSKPSPLPEHGFKCSECDVGNETYDQHLQHIEKHKFQMVMEHLIEKKMDKLCTVCMTKDMDMVKLDRTVNIHGGCPELTGHRSLYNIIGSTMPEQASYKYRELLVANEAKIVTITKKLKNYFLRGNKTIPVMNKENYYPLSNPIIISREIIDGEDYLFLFTKPNDIEQIITVNESFDKAKPNDIEQIITVNESFDKDMVNKNEIEQQNVENFTVMEIVTQALHTSSDKNDIDYENKFTFHFSKPDYDIEVQKEHKDTANVKISENVRAKNKQINWIFGKCYEDNDNTEAKEDMTTKYDMSDETKAGIKKCNYCWIFKNTDKCNNCQKSFKVDSAKVPNKTNDSTEQIQDIEANENKRKIVEHNNTGNKRSKWQCKFCLTNNGDNEKCYCCDTEYQTKDFSHQIKINFGSNKSFFGIDDFSKKSMNIDRMNILSSYTGTKICKKCLDSALTSYIFLNHAHFVRNRLKTCVELMLDCLKNVDQKDGKIFVEISQNMILPDKEPDFIDENLLLEAEEVDESKLKIEVLEDEFRINDSESESESENNENDKKSETLKSGDFKVSVKDEYSEDDDSNPARYVTKTYIKRMLNGLKSSFSYNSISDACSEFLTFKIKRKPKGVYSCKFTCPLCNKHFISDYFLRRHSRKHILKDVRCKICNVKFESKFCLFEHSKIVHVLGNSNYSLCNTCGRTFVNNKKFIKHMKTHRIKECQLCSKFFATQYHYNSHMQRHSIKLKHIREKSIETCSFCEKECSNDNELSVHVNKTHLQIKPYNCDMCERQFYTENNLNCHKRAHSMYTKENCNFCGKNLKCRKALVTHVRKHIGVKPYKCLLCMQNFYSQGKLQKHMKIFHGGQFCCKLCKTVFRTKYRLKKHVNMAHNMI